jgi:hypothetical protein
MVDLFLFIASPTTTVRRGPQAAEVPPADVQRWPCRSTSTSPSTRVLVAQPQQHLAFVAQHGLGEFGVVAALV